MRGKVVVCFTASVIFRITPAYAGKSRASGAVHHDGRDHPRVCGEKQPCCFEICHTTGSPPRMRGKAALRLTENPCRGITPAYAGKSPAALVARARLMDHPRVCGEKHKLAHNPVREGGSPPRMRGKAIFAQFWAKWLRITPAYAGKRARLFRLFAPTGDHPRVCGEKAYNRVISGSE